MAEVVEDCYFYFYSTCIKQTCTISCFWETQPFGCVKINCMFFHSKPRNINGLFLPPSSKIPPGSKADSSSGPDHDHIPPLKETLEGILSPTETKGPLKSREILARPIHPPLVITINFGDEEDEEEEEEEEEKENVSSNSWMRSSEDIEEEEAIKAMCYKSGEYYRFHTPPDVSGKPVTFVVEKDFVKPLETGTDLQEGDGLTIPSKLNAFERQVEIKESLNGKLRTELTTFKNGGGDCYAPQGIIYLGVDESETLTEENEFIMAKSSHVKGSKSFNNLDNISNSYQQKHSVTTRSVNTTHVLNATENINARYKEDPSSMNNTQQMRKSNFKGVKKKKWFYEEPKNSTNPGTRKATQVPNPKTKTVYQGTDKSRNSENASFTHLPREVVRSVPGNSSAHGQSGNRTYNKEKEPRFVQYPDKYSSATSNAPGWKRRMSFSKTYPKMDKIDSGNYYFY
uniref:Chromosome 12 open reading frame 50 n=1 Tax=Ornithorhynchus anatinus TaxID=9258 RepID=A0A6I8NFC3_ORNAN